jgi:hypothetical protein
MPVDSKTGKRRPRRTVAASPRIGVMGSAGKVANMALEMSTAKFDARRDASIHGRRNPLRRRVPTRRGPQRRPPATGPPSIPAIVSKPSQAWPEKYSLTRSAVCTAPSPLICAGPRDRLSCKMPIAPRNLSPRDITPLNNDVEVDLHHGSEVVEQKMFIRTVRIEATSGAVEQARDATLGEVTHV